MVLVLRTIGSGQAGYYRHEQTDGRWVGAGGPALGLTGAVEDGHLRAVLAGRDPDGRPLLRARTDRRPGFDMILAAPKSVSLLTALGTADRAAQLNAAHGQAVTATIGYLERNATWTRRGSAHTRIPTEGLIAAAFDHRWSGAGDPHLHTHVVIGNLVRGDDDRWSCLDSRALYRHAGAAGAVFHASLRLAIAEQGFDFTWTVRARGLGDIVGVPRSAIDAASLRHRQVTKEIEPATAGRRGLATAAGRTRTTAKPGRAQPWDVRVAGAGLDRGRAVDVIESAARSGPTVERHPPAPAETAAVLSERSSRFQRHDVVQAVAGLAAAGASPQLVEQWADNFLTAAVPDGDGVWAVAATLRQEQRIASVATGSDRRPVGRAREPALDAVLGWRTDLPQAGQEAVRRLTTGGARVDLVRGDLMAQASVLDAARAVWEASGHRVAVVGRTERAQARWHALTGMEPPPALPDHASVLVVDSADRWSTQALHQLVNDADARNAKVVLVDGGTSSPRRRAESPAVEALRSKLEAIDCGLVAAGPAARGPADQGPRASVGLPAGNDGSVVLAASGPAAVDLLVDEWYRATAAPTGAATPTGPATPTGAATATAKGGPQPRMVALGPEEAAYLNARARAARTAAGELRGPAVEVAGRPFQVADQVMALRKSPALGSVPSATVGTVVAVDDQERQLTIRWPEAEVVLRAAAAPGAPLTHGYATTPAFLGRAAAGEKTPVLALGDPALLSARVQPEKIFAVMPAPTPENRHPARDRLLAGPPVDATRPLAELWAERDRLAGELRDGEPPDPRPALRRLAEERDWLLAVPDRPGQSRAVAEIDGRMARLDTAAAARTVWLEEHQGPSERCDQLSAAIAWREEALGRGAELRPSRVVLSELGPPPTGSGHRPAWRQAAAAIEAYRERWALPDKPLGLVSGGRDREQGSAARRTDELRVVSRCRALHNGLDRDLGFGM